MRQLELPLFPKVYCTLMLGDSLGTRLDWRRTHGYIKCEVIECASFAGDWTFLVSRDGYTWFPMYQIVEDRARMRYARIVDETTPMYGTYADVVQQWNRNGHTAQAIHDNFLKIDLTFTYRMV
jgi:hypothetical protein